MKNHKGFAEIGYCSRDGSNPKFLHGHHNGLQFTHAEILARLLGQQDTRYFPNTAYVEFANVADPDTAVDTPEYDQYAGVEYYEGLALTSDRDFLRIRLDLANLSLADGFADLGVLYNRITYYFWTVGAAGIHGRPFTDSDNSKVYGLSLVSAPVAEDRTKDLIFGRVYYGAGQQLVKTAGQQIAARYTHTWLPVD